jgi:2-haloacid dehalogenase
MKAAILPTRPALVFDFGGVLFDWSPHYLYDAYFHDDPEAADRFLDEIGFDEWNLQQDKGRPFAAAVADLTERFPQYADLIRAYDQHWEKTVKGMIDPAVRLLETLKQAGYPLYALSNWSEEKFNLIRPRYAFLDWFEAIILSGEVKSAKPETRIFSVLLERVGRPAKECLFIDDSPMNISAAEQLGFQAILFVSPDQLERELSRRELVPRNGTVG